VLPEKLIRLYTRQLLLALEYLHSGSPGIIHHDMKAANILLANNGQSVSIADFGEALESNPDGTYLITRTRITGTKFHHAPEIFRYLKKTKGFESYDAKIDVWALGCVVFEMLTGLSTESVVAQQLGNNAQKSSIP
jgi:mitogen-activated protein kinase kinase kinase